MKSVNSNQFSQQLRSLASEQHITVYPIYELLSSTVLSRSLWINDYFRMAKKSNFDSYSHLNNIKGSDVCTT